MAEKVRYRNVTVKGREISGEHNKYGSWMKFSGTVSLMRIGAVLDKHPRTIRAFMALADGYGSPGFFPSGYDWSGIRDSSKATIKAMEALAVRLWEPGPWPWENTGVTITPTKRGFVITRKPCVVCGEPPFGSEYACGHSQEPVTV